MMRGVSPETHQPKISATAPDWNRERLTRRWDRGGRILRAIRKYQKYEGKRGPLAWLFRQIAVAQHHLWCVLSGAEIPLNTSIGGGLIMPHPNGVIIHESAVIGPNCSIFQQVTIGVTGTRPGAPVIGGHVNIGAGAKILGRVHVGSHSRIGANAVVIRDVPEGAIAVGVPARIIPRKRPVE